jgi:hypothetical protein
MNSGWILILEIAILFIFSRNLTKQISSFVYKKTKNKTITLWVVALMFFPGTFLHEVSHLVMAQILGLPTGRVRLIPYFEDNRLVLGSIPIAHVSQWKTTLTGVAPFITGSFLLAGILYMGTSTQSLSPLAYLGLGYSIFVLINTLFPSNADLKGAWKIGVIIVAFAIAGIVLGVKVPTIPEKIEIMLELLTKMAIIPIVLDGVLLALIKILK